MGEAGAGWCGGREVGRRGTGEKKQAGLMGDYGDRLEGRTGGADQVVVSPVRSL